MVSKRVLRKRYQEWEVLKMGNRDLLARELEGEKGIQGQGKHF